MYLTATVPNKIITIGQSMLVARASATFIIWYISKIVGVPIINHAALRWEIIARLVICSVSKASFGIRSVMSLISAIPRISNAVKIICRSGGFSGNLLLTNNNAPMTNR